MMGQQTWMFQQEARKPRAVGETLGRFWRYFRRYTHVLIAVVVLVIASTFLQVAVPSLMGQAVDCFLVPAPAVSRRGEWRSSWPTVSMVRRRRASTTRS